MMHATRSRRPSRRAWIAGLAAPVLLRAQTPDGDAIWRRFSTWRREPAQAGLAWEALTARFSQLLAAEGRPAAEVDRLLAIVASRDEASLYDPIYQKPTRTPTAPTPLLLTALGRHAPGRALDVGMGQGRNALEMARRGWKVTGFDVAAEGIAAARRQAAAEGLSLDAVEASDLEFDFGQARWDLIAILYPIEKRSVFRVREALAPGGLVVVECSHKEAAKAGFEYGTNELLDIFRGFEILFYEDAPAQHEWARKRLRMVKLIARKP